MGQKRFFANLVAQFGSRPRITEKPTRLLLASGHASFLNTGNQLGSGHAHRFADSEKEIDRGRLLVVFELADVGAVDLRRKGEFLLRQFRFVTGLPNFVAKHPGNLFRDCQRVC